MQKGLLRQNNSRRNRGIDRIEKGFALRLAPPRRTAVRPLRGDARPRRGEVRLLRCKVRTGRVRSAEARVAGVDLLRPERFKRLDAIRSNSQGDVRELRFFEVQDSICYRRFGELLLRAHFDIHDVLDLRI